VLDFPIRMTGLKSVKPLYAEPSRFGARAEDEFGVIWATTSVDRGSPIGPCLPDPDLTGYSFPDAADPFRFEDMETWCLENSDHFRIVWVGDLWERAAFMRGLEEILFDLVLHPQFVRDLLRRLADRIRATMEILFGSYEFEGIAVSDDYGTQRALMMAPDVWRQFIKPLLAEIYGAARVHGRIAFHHSCGDVSAIVPDLIEIGLDILHPIQPEAMDIFGLKREYGDDLTFCGGVRTQDLLPQGTAEEVRKEVKRLKRHMGSKGGYILEPGITLQADVPLENLEAMIDEAIHGNDW